MSETSEPIEVRVARLRGWTDFAHYTHMGWQGTSPMGQRGRLPAVRGREACALAMELTLEMVHEKTGGRAGVDVMIPVRAYPTLGDFVDALITEWIRWRESAKHGTAL